MEIFEIAVIGGGPAGYIAGIRAAQLGAKVVLFEKDVLGGTCLNRGCIPAKTFLKGAEIIHSMHMAKKYGINNSTDFTMDMKQAVANKNSVVKTLTSGVGGLLRSNGVTVVEGEAELKDENTVICKGKEYRADSIILCGGSKAIKIPIPGIEDENVLTSNEILGIEELPGRLIVIGGGVIGCEMACAFNGYGSKVTIIEALDRILPPMDEEVSAQMRKFYEKDGIEIITGAGVEKIERKNGEMVVYYSGGKFVTGDKILLSIGRAAELECLGALKDKIKQERGKVVVDDYMQTNVPGIYAAGDITGRLMLAHTAFKMGERAAENACGAHKTVDFKHVASCVYTIPECSAVGLSEKAAKEQGYDVAVGKFPMQANGRSLASGATEGFIKVVMDKKYGELLGVHMIAADAAEMIAEPAALAAAEIPVDEIADMIHAHPSYAEAFMEACADAEGRCMHLPKKK